MKMVRESVDDNELLIFCWLMQVVVVEMVCALLCYCYHNLLTAAEKGNACKVRVPFVALYRRFERDFTTVAPHH